MAVLVARNLRDEDGDAFQGSLESGRAVAERLRKQLQDLQITDARGERIPVAASFGIATLRAGETIRA